MTKIKKHEYVSMGDAGPFRCDVCDEDEDHPIHQKRKPGEEGAYLASRRESVLRSDLTKLASHASHYGNCPLDSWSPRLVRCQCGLFQLLTRLERADLIPKERRG